MCQSSLFDLETANEESRCILASAKGTVKETDGAANGQYAELTLKCTVTHRVAQFTKLDEIGVNFDLKPQSF